MTYVAANEPCWADNPHCVCATGFADLPKGTTAYELYRVISFVMIIDPASDTIVDAEFSFGLQLTRDFTRVLVIGQKTSTLERNIGELVHNRFLSPISGAIVHAVHNACDRYHEWQRASQ